MGILAHVSVTCSKLGTFWSSGHTAIKIARDFAWHVAILGDEKSLRSEVRPQSIFMVEVGLIGMTLGSRGS